MPEKAAAPKEEAKPAQKVKREPVRSEEEVEDLMNAFYEAIKREYSVSIAEMAKVMGLRQDTVRKKLNKYPERFAPYLGRVSLVGNKRTDD